MKRFLVSILVPASAAIAVVGSGFSVWYFGDKEVKSSTSADLEVKNLLQVGSFTTELNTLKLTFDQTTAGREKALALKGNADDELKDLEATGITFTGTQTSVTYTSPSNPAEDHGDYGTNHVKTQIKSVVKIEGGLENWLTVTTNDTKVTSETDGFTYVWDDSNEATRTLDLATVFKFEYAPKGTHYDSLSADKADRTDFASCEPLNAKEYEIMRNALSTLNKKITITTTATLVKYTPAA